MLTISTLSTRQRKFIDRAGGACLILPWPQDLALEGPAPLLTRRRNEWSWDDARTATPTECAAATRILLPACQAYDLLIDRVYVATLERPPSVPHHHTTAPHLVPVLISRRYASTAATYEPHTMWWAGEN